MKKSDYYLLCDTEIMFFGEKKDCIDYFKSFSNPVPMKLIRVAYETELKNER